MGGQIGRRAALAGAAVLALPALTRAQAAAVKIGMIHPVTGPLAFGGSQCRLGGQTAIDDVNREGGIKSLGGAKLEAMLGDAQGKPEVASALVDQMAEAKVAAITGCYASNLCLAATQTAAKYGIPFSIDSGIADAITARGLPNVYRLFPQNSVMTDGAIACLDQLNKGVGSPAKSAVIVHEDSEFGTSTAKLLAQKLGGIGIEVKETIAHATPTRDFTNIVLRIKAAAPDLVVITNYPNEYQLLLRTLVQQRVNLVAACSVSGGGFNLPFAKSQPEASQAMIDFNHWHNPKDPRGAQFRKRIEDAGHTYGWEVLFGYFAVRLLADAMERAASADAAKLLPALAASTYHDFWLPYGPTRFVGGQNQAARGLGLQIQSGDIVVIWPADYAEARAIFPRPKV
ncbi:MAG: ABC transporter substrate-binding protein [Acidisphaera sp.]|nr:ABC transporter substrate-binding protein [Acidisphaera sp.]